MPLPAALAAPAGLAAALTTCAEPDADAYELNEMGNRAAARSQLPPKERPGSDRPAARWACYADVAKLRTGNACRSGWTFEAAGPFLGKDAESAAACRSAFIRSYMNPITRKRRDVEEQPMPHPQEDETRRLRFKKPKATFADGQTRRGGHSRAGPGRGHRDESARPLPIIETGSSSDLEPFPHPPDATSPGNWLQKLSAGKQWQTAAMENLAKRVEHLEQQLNERSSVVWQKDETIRLLRNKVARCENQLQVAVEHIVSNMETMSVLTQNSTQNERLEESPQLGFILGTGYATKSQKRSLVYKHLSKLVQSLRKITGGDAMKAKELSELLAIRTHATTTAHERPRVSFAEHWRDVTEGVVNSLRRYVEALHEAGGNGRYPYKVRQALQIVATAVSRFQVFTKGGNATLKEVGDYLSLNPKLISASQRRFDLLDEGEWEDLYDDRGALRSDTIPEEWLNFAMEFWAEPELSNENNEAYNFTRRAESMSKVVRDPKNRKSKESHRIHWLEEALGVIYETMVARGKKKFGDGFHMSWPFFLELRPYYVKDATRETCMCIYHLRFEEFATGLLSYRRALKQQHIVSCRCTVPENARNLRKLLVCPRLETECEADSQDPKGFHVLDNVKCMLQECDRCKDLKLMTVGPCGMCSEEMRDTGGGGLALKVKYESYEKLEYVTKDGTRKEKKDFVSKQANFSEFLKDFKAFWPKFIAHHNDAKWHDDDFISLRSLLPHGHAGLVIDFAENYSHQPRFEHQSKYFSQVQTTIVPVVLMLRVDDLANISTEAKSELLKLLEDCEQPPVVSETHYLISSDMNHDNAFIQKGLDDHIIPYIKAASPTTTSLHIRSDGCKAQFKCAANFNWVSRQLAEGCGMQVNWSFFESCHGKCLCDPEGGTIKNAARHHELTISEKDKQLKNSEAFFSWAANDSGLHTPRHSLAKRNGRGIFRRFFYWIPSKGAGAVDRSRLPKLKAEGTSRLHEFVDIGVPGTVSTRRASCHRCHECWSFNRSACKNRLYVGAPTELQIKLEKIPSAAVDRMDRTALNRAAIARASEAAAQSVVCIETHKDEQMHPWVLAEVLQTVHNASCASRPHDPQTDPVHFEPVKASEPALNVRLFEALEPGSMLFYHSDVELIVPARMVRVINITLEAVRATARLQGLSRQKFRIEESSLHAIRAEMPTSNDDWEVESVLQYRCIYNTEQWLVKWKGFSDVRNTWEPWESLLTAEVQEEAASCRVSTFAPTVEGLQKAHVLTLKAILARCGMDTSGVKALLVQRVVNMLRNP